MGSLVAALLIAGALLFQTASRVRGWPATALFNSSVLEDGGYYPGMPSVQTLGVVVLLGPSGLLMAVGVLPAVRSMLLFTSAIAGVFGLIVTVVSYLADPGALDLYGYSIGSATMTLLVALSLTGLRRRSAPATVIRTHPWPAVLVLVMAGLLGAPATWFYTSATSGARSVLGG